MSYKYSNGRYQIIGDLSGSDDANRDTGIDFEENEIKLVAGGTPVLKEIQIYFLMLVLVLPLFL